MMDCKPIEIQSLTKTQIPSTLTKFMLGLQASERVFAMHQLNKNNQPKNRRYFSHLESRAIKEQMKIFLKNPDDVTNRDFSLGFFTIDFKFKRIYQTDDPANTEEQFVFEEVP